MSFPPVSEEHRHAENQALTPPPRLLLGPGPSNGDPRVLQSMALPLVGHLDPYFQNLMIKVQNQLRYVWQTKAKTVLPISGTGSCAMECTIVNLIEEGDKVLILKAGYFGERMIEMAKRVGGDVVVESLPWGSTFSLPQIEEALKTHKPQILGLVHAETSTGACQPLVGISSLCQSYGTLLLLDTVTSMGGVPLFLDDWGVDAAYSGTQKCLGAPPGLAPVMFSDRAMAKILNRKEPVRNWYLDIKLITSYWSLPGSGGRAYHHTAPVSMNYALYEALRIVEEEGLEARWSRHYSMANLFWTGLKDIGLECHVPLKDRLPPLTTVKIPNDVDGAKVVAYLRDQYNIEIAGGLGELAGKVWRIGLMGYNARKENVVLLLAALKDAISHCKK